MTNITVTIVGSKITMQAGIADPEKTEGMSRLEVLALMKERQIEDYLANKVMDILRTHVTNLSLELKRQTELAKRKKAREEAEKN